MLVEPEDMARLGQTVGNYRLNSILGRGGMGTVYAGEHVYIRKPVALKVLHPQFAKYPEAVNRFLREARAASLINHANIVDVTDFGLLPDGVVYFVMEYLEGESLEDIIERDSAVELYRAINIANQIALALDAAHAQKIIHRDLKPDNIMLLRLPGRRDLVRMGPDHTWVSEREKTFDFVKVLDFGIAKMVDPDDLTAETIKGAVFGTPEYMSPEAARGEEVDHRSDIYSLGVILFDMLCGRPPFEAEQGSDVLKMHISKAPPRPREYAAHREITEHAERCILKALEKDRNKRYQTMREFRDDLQNAYGSVHYRRHAREKGLISEEQADAAAAAAASRPKRLTDEIHEWFESDQKRLSVEEARQLALVGDGDALRSTGKRSPEDAARLADELEKHFEE